MAGNCFLQHRGLLNFRDLGVSTADNSEQKRYIREGLLFRSGSLDNLSNEQVQQFIQDHGIRTILDLRTGYESQEDLPIDKSFPTMALENIRPVDMLPVTKADGSIHVDEYSGLRRKYRIDFAGKNFQRYCIFMACPLHIKIWIILLMIFCQRKRAAVIVGREVLTPMGVANMYKQFVDYCQSEILHALMVFTDPDNYPIHIHCTQGKDRTGLIACFLLSIAGVPEEIIVKDYAKTQAGLQPIRTEMIKELRKVGLSDDFADSPPEYMWDLLEYLQTKYGSVCDYLETIGFDKGCQDRVRKIICVSS